MILAADLNCSAAQLTHTHGLLKVS